MRSTRPAISARPVEEIAEPGSVAPLVEVERLLVARSRPSRRPASRPAPSPNASRIQLRERNRFDPAMAGAADRKARPRRTARRGGQLEAHLRASTTRIIVRDAGRDPRRSTRSLAGPSRAAPSRSSCRTSSCGLAPDGTLARRAESRHAAARAGEPGLPCPRRPQRQERIPTRASSANACRARTGSRARWSSAREDDPQGRERRSCANRTASSPIGVSQLRPLNLKTVADAIGMHESTVSRVTSNKAIGTVPAGRSR